MASDARDPWEIIDEDLIQAAGAADGADWPDDLLLVALEDFRDRLRARLDAADPLRAMLGEVVAEVEAAADCLSVGQVPGAVRALSRALARLRTLTPTEGGTDDAER